MSMTAPEFLQQQRDVHGPKVWAVIKIAPLDAAAKAFRNKPVRNAQTEQRGIEGLLRLALPVPMGRNVGVDIDKIRCGSEQSFQRGQIGFGGKLAYLMSADETIELVNKSREILVRVAECARFTVEYFKL